jgi:glycerol-3-phosphate dehydrogenase (NAD+)
MRHVTLSFLKKMTGKKVCIVGSGNWGSAIAKLAGQNAAEKEMFDNTVNMWVYEEMIEGRKLTEIINEDHENVKYLPGVKLPENVVAVPELLDAARDADLFIFVIPHQFISRLVGQMKGNIKENAAAISLLPVEGWSGHCDKFVKPIVFVDKVQC